MRYDCGEEGESPSDLGIAFRVQRATDEAKVGREAPRRLTVFSCAHRNRPRRRGAVSNALCQCPQLVLCSIALIVSSFVDGCARVSARNTPIGVCVEQQRCLTRRCFAAKANATRVLRKEDVPVDDWNVLVSLCLDTLDVVVAVRC